jgi:hypothetical protein
MPRVFVQLRPQRLTIRKASNQIAAPKKRKLSHLIDKNCQNIPPVSSMNSEDLSRQFLSLKGARAPDTIIGILRKKMRDLCAKG